MKFSTLMGGNRVPKVARKIAENCTNLCLSRNPKRRRNDSNESSQFYPTHKHTRTPSNGSCVKYSGVFFGKERLGRHFVKAL